MQLPALVRLGHGDDARDAVAAARSEMDASPVAGRPGRFGFDRAELELHLAEAALGLSDPGTARAHAEESLRQTTVGRPGWVAATLVLAQGSAAGGFPDHGAELALHVLDTIPREMLRSTSWRRLMALDRHLTATRSGGTPAAELHERLLARQGPSAMYPLTGRPAQPVVPAPRPALSSQRPPAPATRQPRSPARRIAGIPPDDAANAAASAPP